MKKLASVFPILLAAMTTSGDAAPDARETSPLFNWLEKQKSLETLRTDFTQTRKLRAVKKPLVSPGKLYYRASTGSFRWQLGEPVKTIALRDGGDVLLISPPRKRAQRRGADADKGKRWSGASALFEAGFPRGRDDFEKKFRILSVQQVAGGHLAILELREREARKYVIQIRLTIDRDLRSLRAFEAFFKDGSSIRNDFTNAVLNRPLPKDAFAFDLTGYAVKKS